MTNVTIETKPFLDSIGRASIIITDVQKAISAAPSLKTRSSFSARRRSEKISDSVSAVCDGPEVVIGFNNRYMADALKASECEKLKIEMNGPISPMKLVPVDDDSFLFLVLPVRLKS